nr:YchJ family protein [Lentzea tibetensis]
MRNRDEKCPCGSNQSYADCCGALHSGERTAATAEQLMRSRYSAFAVADEAYLLRTWHPSKRPSDLDLDPGQRWTGLEILGTSGGGLLQNEGTVEFRAQSTDGVVHEVSRFVRDGGQWVYLEGTHR